MPNCSVSFSQSPCRRDDSVRLCSSSLRNVCMCMNVPLSLFVVLECYVNRLCLWVLTRDSLTLFDDAIWLQKRFDVLESSLQRYAANNNLWRRNTVNKKRKLWKKNQKERKLLNFVLKIKTQTHSHTYIHMYTMSHYIRTHVNMYMGF